MNNFNRKNTLITGGSSGIGLSLAKQLVKKGSNVWIIARRQELLDQAIKEIETQRITPDQKISALSADVSDEKGVFKVLSEFQNANGIPDFLINAAGISRPGLFLDIEPDIFQKLMNVNYFGTVYTIKALLPGMIARKSGYIVNISSIAGFGGVYGYSAYGATKYAIKGLSDTLLFELKHTGVGLSVVFPPDTQTPGLEADEPYLPEITKELSRQNSTILSPDKVAESIIRNVEKNKYIITPGFDSSFLFFLNFSLGTLSYRVIDFLLENARKAVNKHHS